MNAKRTVAKTKKKAIKRPVAAGRRPARTKVVTTRPAAKGKRPAAKRAVRRRKATPLSIPTILLEGDHPTSPIATGPGEKFALGPTAPEQHFEPESTALPESYGTQRLYLTARDPHWLYANWDFTREQQLRYNNQSTDGHLILRIFAKDVGRSPLVEIHVHPESRHWFANVERAGVEYTAEIGFYRKNRKWISIATSGATLTPPETVSTDADAEFATIPVDVPFEDLLTLVAQAVREHRPLAQAVEALRRAGHPQLPPVTTMPTAPWTPEQERALAEVVSLDHVRRVWIGSLEITELVRRHFERGVSSLSLPTPSVGGVSSISSPFGGELARGKGFWFNVNAELVIYGSTESDASVSIGGRKIKLRHDGTFTCRFSFPDGKYDLPVVAVSADDTDGRAAELKFSRTTDFLGDVGAQPQDPALKPPTPDNV